METNLLLKDFLQKGNQYTAVEILQKCNDENNFHIGIELGKLFVKFFPDNPIILLSLSKLAFQAKNYELCYDTLTMVKKMHIPENILGLVFKTGCDCISHIKDRYIGYNDDIVQRIVNRQENKFPLITLTITTCKRYDLFEKTMNSFLNCCLDLDRIDRWLCIDDNSSEEDREKMKKNYPFFEFYFKTYEEKGHPQSMNILRNKVTTPYVFHMEDDWKFICKRNYLSECMNVLGENEKIGQCLINKNYTETEKDFKVVGGILHRTSAGTRYYVHEYCKTQEDFDKLYKKHGFGPNSAYWKHFSFRPSLLRKYILDELGPFDEKVSHFEAEYSQRYFDAGYISAFLDDIYSLHIGRLTSERFDETKANAYVLNGEKQLGGKEEALAKKAVGFNVKTYVVNLDYRTDRWEAFKKLEEPKFLDYVRFSAIDGKKLVPNKQLQRIFEGNDYIMRQGMVGCAMSHIKLWIQLLTSSADAYCIFEDDITFVPNFRDKFLHLYNNLPADWDVCFLGHHLWKKFKTDDNFDKEVFPVVEKWNVIQSLTYSMGGTGGYLISKKGAKGLLEFINKTGMTNGIDTMQQKAADVVNVYYCKPHLIYSECWTPQSNTDTDIQHNFVSLDLGQVVSREEYPERLLKNGVFNIDEALSFKSEKERHIISLSETTHTSEAIKNFVNTEKAFPFDLTDGGKIEDFIQIVKDILESKTDEKLQKIVSDFVISNNYGIIFPHENKSDLCNIYFEKFKNLQQVILGDNKLIFLHVSRWRKTTMKVLEDFIDFLRQFNQDVVVATVNGLDSNEIISEKYRKSMCIKNLYFPEEYMNDSWDSKKIFYDQKNFRVELSDLVKKILQEL